MIDVFLILNIRECLKQSEDGEDMLRQVFSTFSCEKNTDVERFDTKEVKSSTENAHMLIQLLKVL